MDRSVCLFDGTTTRIVCGDDEVNETVYRIMIEPFLAELNDGWLAKNERSMLTENRIKGYLTYVGYMFVPSPDKYNILSRNKIDYINSREVLTDEIEKSHSPNTPSVVARKKKWPMTTFEKYMSLISARKGNKLTSCRVATDGVFAFDDTRYRVIDSKYAGRRIAGFPDLQYDFDRIWILSNEATGILRFFDQRLDEIIPEHIFVENKEEHDGKEWIA